MLPRVAMATGFKSSLVSQDVGNLFQPVECVDSALLCRSLLTPFFFDQLGGIDPALKIELKDFLSWPSVVVLGCLDGQV